MASSYIINSLTAEIRLLSRDFKITGIYLGRSEIDQLKRETLTLHQGLEVKNDHWEFSGIRVFEVFEHSHMGYRLAPIN